MKLKAISDGWDTNNGDILVRTGRTYEGHLLLEDGELLAIVFGDTEEWSVVPLNHFEPAEHGKKFFVPEVGHL